MCKVLKVEFDQMLHATQHTFLGYASDGWIQSITTTLWGLTWLVKTDSVSLFCSVTSGQAAVLEVHTHTLTHTNTHTGPHYKSPLIPLREFILQDSVSLEEKNPTAKQTWPSLNQFGCPVLSCHCLRQRFSPEQFRRSLEIAVALIFIESVKIVG